MMVWFLVLTVATGQVELGSYTTAEACAKSALRMSAQKLPLPDGSPAAWCVRRAC
jgi:hypothetical protein